ncbi:MarR family winged helix-turn-helix transcriptional regulator [Arsenicibacter rosenii]|uniref:MarR family transcriptional regulator n=1 Tax=Arsenicibacter rosenii TaxID=1750698 RepID=A0A1S2VJ76_9BACT|nr:MarR family transcriptional regulator [Arsenicibacter rosenii]OIN57878.1 MarR family transcriptional regulator [Arsenicibacter rosenii]
MTTAEKLHLENQLCFPLYVASRLTTRMYGPLLEELDVTYPQYLVLLALWQTDSQTVGELTKRLYLETNTLTPLLKRLEQKQYISRKRSVTDERSVQISLTESGQALKEQALCIPEKIAELVRDSTIDMQELTSFYQTLQKIIQNAG